MPSEERYYPGQVFEIEYPEEAADWCNASKGKYYIDEIAQVTEGIRRFQIKEVPPPEIEDVRANKHNENDSKANEARTTQTFTAEIADGINARFITDRQTQTDLQTALLMLANGMEAYPWVDEDGVSFEFTSTDQIALVSMEFMQRANVYEKWAYYHELICNATTLAELVSIEIDYSIEVTDLPMADGEEAHESEDVDAGSDAGE